MLAGLIFATENAEDRPDRLAATLPFGGLTLLEFQARLLTAAGASHIILVVSRMTPELLGASNRIGRRVATLDVVRTVGEVVEKVHPLARVLVIADGVATSGDAVRLLPRHPGDTLVTIADGAASAGYERIGVDGVWAGLALIDAERLAEVAALPRDWSFQSALLRVAAQAGAAHLALPPELALRHDVERDSRRLAARGDAAVASLLHRPSRWADRFVIGPAARIVLRLLIALGIGVALAAGGAVAGWAAMPLVALILLALMLVAAASGGAAAELRDEASRGRLARLAPPLLLALVVMVAELRTVGESEGWLAGGMLIAFAALVERIAGERLVRRWWASPAALVLVMILLVPVVGLFGATLIAGGYALATLTAAIERARSALAPL